MEKRKLLIIIGAVVAFIVAIAIGRFLGPTKTVTEIKKVEVEKIVHVVDEKKLEALTAQMERAFDQMEQMKMAIRRTENTKKWPDGMIETNKTEEINIDKTVQTHSVEKVEVEKIVIQERVEKVEVDKLVFVDKIKTVTSDAPRLDVDLTAGVKLAPAQSPAFAFGAGAKYRFAGPFTVGASYTNIPRNQEHIIQLTGGFRF